MKLNIEIDLRNDALINDRVGEVLRMIKLAIRKTDLQDGCSVTLQDINGQPVGKLEVTSDMERIPTKDDFTKGDKITITAIISNREVTLKDVTVSEVTNKWIQVENLDEGYIVMYNKITQM